MKRPPTKVMIAAQERTKLILSWFKQNKFTEITVDRFAKDHDMSYGAVADSFRELWEKKELARQKVNRVYHYKYAGDWAPSVASAFENMTSDQVAENQLGEVARLLKELVNAQKKTNLILIDVKEAIYTLDKMIYEINNNWIERWRDR